MSVPIGPPADGSPDSFTPPSAASTDRQVPARDRRRAVADSPARHVRLAQQLASGLAHLAGWRGPWSFRRRRCVSLFSVVLAWSILQWLVTWAEASLLRPSVLTGWTLMGCLALLMTVAVRRRLPILPLGSVSTWTQVHIYTGLFATGAFLLHTPHLWAAVGAAWTSGGTGVVASTGWLEGVLAMLFLAVSGSGFYGWVACRRLPPRLSAVDGEVRFDQIGWHRQQVADAAAERIGSLHGQAAVAVLGDFYAKQMKAYFRTRPSWWYLAYPRSTRRRRLLTGLTQLDRYLEAEGRGVSGQLAGLVRRRDDLDYQYALQWRLRVWVVLHAAMSLALIVLAVLHGILATRFVQS